MRERVHNSGMRWYNFFEGIGLVGLGQMEKWGMGNVKRRYENY